MGSMPFAQLKQVRKLGLNDAANLVLPSDSSACVQGSALQPHCCCLCNNIPAAMTMGVTLILIIYSRYVLDRLLLS